MVSESQQGQDQPKNKVIERSKKHFMVVSSLGQRTHFACIPMSKLLEESSNVCHKDDDV
jgi:hypothetical protein